MSRQWHTTASLLHEQVTSWSRGALLTVGEGYLSGSARYKKTSPLFPSIYRDCPNLTSIQVNTSKRWLYRKDCQMGHNSRSFWYQIHTTHFYKGLGPHWFGSRVCWTSRRSRGEAAWHGWKIGWSNLHARFLVLESICGWSSKPVGSMSGASFGIPRKDHH